MKNLHILTTSKPSRLLNCIEGFRLFEEEVSPDNEWCVNVNIHITSDEEIKEGDPRINNYQRKLKGEEIPSKKIILTTDIDLIKYGVQSVDDEFLEWFVKNPSCEVVLVRDKPKVKAVVKGLGVKNFNNGYKIIIPKEEPKKVLTEEDIFNQKDIDAVTDYINKEQQKQHLIDIMESDEELGLYEQIDQNNPVTKGSTALVKEIKLEDIFNDEKREGAKRVIHQHKVLKGLYLINPAHLEMTSDGHGEFPDGYKLTHKGIQYIIKQLNKE